MWEITSTQHHDITISRTTKSGPYGWIVFPALLLCLLNGLRRVGAVERNTSRAYDPDRQDADEGMKKHRGVEDAPRCGPEKSGNNLWLSNRIVTVNSPAFSRFLAFSLVNRVVESREPGAGERLSVAAELSCRKIAGQFCHQRRMYTVV